MKIIKTPGSIILIIVLVLIVSCNKNNSRVKKENSIDLGDKEVLNYKGEKLDSINKFRENSIKGPQYINVDEYSLILNGLVKNPVKLSYNDVLSLQSYKKLVTLNCVEGWSVKILWEGILVKDLLKNVEPENNANTVIFYAKDGYSTSLPLKYIIDNNIIIAYKMNNIVLPPKRGFPFQLIAEQKWGYKWIKWITRIELSNNPDYKGFWESRGYSNDADLNKI